ncbi:hypothetical protein Tamer19_41570 [Cupriavidus sp. TA19]|nr:hypothetical protein Tamer19_41570 [Cupriavidus sp. TA19]
MDIRDIQRLHEQFAHAPLTLEAPTNSNHTVSGLLPPPAYSYAATGVTQRWTERAGGARLIVTVITGIVAAGALGMSIATWLHGRETTVTTPESVATAPVQTTAPEKESSPAPAVVAVADAALVPTSMQPVELRAKTAEPVQPSVLPSSQVAASVPRPSPAPGGREGAPVARKAEPAPAIAKAPPASPPARRTDGAAEIKLF